MKKLFTSEFYIEKIIDSSISNYSSMKTFTDSREVSDADYIGELSYNSALLIPINEIIL